MSMASDSPLELKTSAPCQCPLQPFLRPSCVLCQIHSQRHAKPGFCLHVKGLCPAAGSLREGLFCFRLLQNKNVRNVAVTFRGWGELVMNAERKLIFYTRTASSLF